MRTNTDSFHSTAWAQFGIERSRVLLDCSVHFLNVMVSIHRVGKVHTHQLDAMMVDRDRRRNGPFVDVLSVIDSFSSFLVQQKSNSVFVVICSCSHENVFLVCLPNF